MKGLAVALVEYLGRFVEVVLLEVDTGDAGLYLVEPLLRHLVLHTDVVGGIVAVERLAEFRDVEVADAHVVCGKIELVGQMFVLSYLLGAHEVLDGVGETLLAHIGLAEAYQTVGLLGLALGVAGKGGRQHHRHSHEHG